MARVAPIYTSFARGEVSPLMFGRIDLEQYPTLLDKCRNCWVRPYGVVSRFAGSEYINSTKDGNFARLIKFVFSADDSYIIEVGVGYFRFYYNGGVVLKDGEVYEVENSWTEEQIASLQYVQLDDIIKFSVLPVGSDNSTAKLMELVRKASDDWEFREVELKSTPYLDENITDTTITPSGATGDITLTASDDLFEEGHIGSYWWVGGTVTEDNEQVQGYVQITKVESKTKALAKVIKKLSGTSATKRWGEGAWSGLRGYPAVVALYDGRIYYARTPHQPRNIYASKPYAYETFTPSPNNEDDGGLNIELATNANGDGSDIKWMIGASYLLCGTYGGEFIIRGTGDGAITPTDVSARQRTNWGGERIQPVVAGTFVHFIQRNGKKLRQFQYDYYYDSYKAVDVSIFSEHFFESGIKDIAYVKNTDSMLLLLNNKGEVVVLTLEQDQAIQAYSLLEFNGVVESIEAIPSHNGNYDEIWYVIKRNINGQEVRYLERIQDPITPDNQEDCWYVRSGLQYNAYNLTKDNELILSGLTGEITAIATNDIFEENDLNKRIRVIDEKGAVLGQATITKVTDAKSVNLKVVKDFQDTKIQGGLWGVSTNTISGLDHLENENVQILADGAVQTDKVVQEGKVLLELDAWKITAGLGYTSYITTMPLEAGSQNGTAVGKRKRISELSVRLWKTSGCRIGRDLDNLQQVRYRTPNTPLGTPLGLFTGLIPNIKYNQGWEWVANVTVEQSSPLPMNILAIAPIMTEVDK